MFKKEIPIVFVGLSMVVAALVLGWSVFVKSEVPVQVPVVSDDEIVIDDDISIVENDDNSEIDISDWKTYQNEEFGFEIKHPENWEVTTGEDESWHKDVFYITGHSIKDPFYAPIAITVRSNEKRLSIKEWYQEYYPNGDVSRLQEVKFDKTNGMRKLSLWSDGLDGFYFSNKDKIYSVSIMDLQENAENQIMMNEKLLSTFKFIES